MSEGLLAETVTFRGHRGDPLPGYLARPLGPGPHPTVIVLHHRDGWDWASKEITRRLAAEGFCAFLPHLHHRSAPGEAPEKAAAIAREAGGISDEQCLGDTVGALEFIRPQPFSNGLVGILGYCSGGRQAYTAACSAPFDAAIVCYGGRIVASPDELHERMPVAAIDLTPGLTSPVLGLFGARDTNPSPEKVALLQARLEAHGKPHRFVTYEEAGHAFFAVDRPTYTVSAAMQGWQEKLAWLDQHLRA
jgi:carboxymethylenebutenolidase